MTERSGEETRRVLNVYERFAHRYDRSVRFWERVLGLDEGRRWVAARARGDVLEIGIGTGRNLPYYPAGVRVTGSISPRPCSTRPVVASGTWGGRPISGWATLRPWTFRTRRSTRRSSPCPSVPFRTTNGPWRRPFACSAREVRCCSSNTSAVRSPWSGPAGASSSRCSCGLRRIISLEPLDHLRAVGFVDDHIERSHWGIVEGVAARKPLRRSTAAP